MLRTTAPSAPPTSAPPSTKPNRPLRLRLLPLLVALVLAGCQPEVQEPKVYGGGVVRPVAPAVALPTEAGPVHLSTLRGTPVVVQFAAAADADAWAALADAAADLEASGAVVLAVQTDGAGAAAAEAFGYAGLPLAVVVDGEGTVRGRTAPTSGDAVFGLAAPVLAEADLAQTVAWTGASTLDLLVDAGGVVISVAEKAIRADADSSLSPAVLSLSLEALSVEALPADLGTPLAFVGEAAEDAARRAVSWGYAAVYVASAEGALREVEAERPTLDDWRSRRGSVRG